MENNWAVLCSSGLYCAVVGCTELCWAATTRDEVHRVDRDSEVDGDDGGDGSVQRM